MTLPKDIKRSKRIGELNGKWAFLLKTFLIFMPMFTMLGVSWGVWVTNAVFDLQAFDVRSEMDRFTITQREQIQGDLNCIKTCLESIHKKETPEPWLIERMVKLETAVVDNTLILNEMKIKMAVIEQEVKKN